MDLRPSLSALFEAFGVSAVATPPDGLPVSCVVVWLSATEMQPKNGDLRRADTRRSLAVRTADMPSMPRGTRFSVPEGPGEEAVEFVLDSVDNVEHGLYRVTVVRRP